jgi:hypothetical protein
LTGLLKIASSYALLLALVLVLSSCGGGTSGSSDAGGGSTSIVGKVLSPEGIPIDRVLITVLETGQSTFSNEAGDFTLTTQFTGPETTLLFLSQGGQAQLKLTGLINNPKEITVVVLLDTIKLTVTMIAYAVEAEVTPTATPTPSESPAASATPTPFEPPVGSPTATPPIDVTPTAAQTFTPTPTAFPTPPPSPFTDPLDLPPSIAAPPPADAPPTLQIIQGYITVDFISGYENSNFPGVVVFNSQGQSAWSYSYSPVIGVFQALLLPGDSTITITANSAFPPYNELARVGISNLPNYGVIVGVELRLTHETDINGLPYTKLSVLQIKTKPIAAP